MTKPPPTVALVMPNFRLGGAERQAVELACALPAVGWRAAVITCDPAGPLRARLESAGIPWHDAGARFALPKSSPAFWLNLAGTVRRIARFASQEGAVILQSFLYWENQVTIPAAMIAPGVKAVVTGRRDMGTYKDGRRWYQWVENATNPFCDAIVCNSRGVRGDVFRRERVDRSRVHVIPNGVDFERFAHAAPIDLRARFPEHLSGAALILGTVGNLKRAKRHDILIEAVARLATEHGIDAAAVIVGADRGEGPALRALAERLGVARRVVFAGAIEDPAPWYRAFDLFLLTSDHEGMPNVVLEAMSAGVPVLTRPVPGVRELIRDGVHGRIVSGTGPEFAAAVAALASESAAERQAMAERAQRRMERHFSPNALATRYAALYDQLLKRGRA